MKRNLTLSITLIILLSSIGSYAFTKDTWKIVKANLNTRNEEIKLLVDIKNYQSFKAINAKEEEQHRNKFDKEAEGAYLNFKEEESNINPPSTSTTTVETSVPVNVDNRTFTITEQAFDTKIVIKGTDKVQDHFTQLYQGSGGVIYLFKDNERANILVGKSKATRNVKVTDAEGINYFDKTLERLKEITFLKVHNWLLIALSALMYLLPFLLAMYSIGYFSLLLVIDNQLVKDFCHNYFDIYKFMSFGGTSVETVKPTKIILSIILSISLLMMVYYGTFLDVLIFCVRAIAALIGRSQI